jgi:hypothetical protein
MNIEIKNIEKTMERKLNKSGTTNIVKKILDETSGVIKKQGDNKQNILKKDNIEYCQHIINLIDDEYNPLSKDDKDRFNLLKNKFVSKKNEIITELDNFYEDVELDRIILEKLDDFTDYKKMFGKARLDDHITLLYKRIRDMLDVEQKKLKKGQSVSNDCLFEIINYVSLIYSNVSEKENDIEVKFITFDTDIKLLNFLIGTDLDEIQSKIENLKEENTGKNIVDGMIKTISTKTKLYDDAKLAVESRKNDIQKQKLRGYIREKYKCLYFECVLEITKVRNDTMKEEFGYGW